MLKHRHFISTLKAASFNLVRPMVGVATLFAAGLTSGLAKIHYSAFANEPDSSLAQHIDTGIHAGVLLGLGSARRLAGEGFRVNRRDNMSDYPLVEVKCMTSNQSRR